MKHRHEQKYKKWGEKMQREREREKVGVTALSFIDLVYPDFTALGGTVNQELRPKSKGDKYCCCRVPAGRLSFTPMAALLSFRPTCFLQSTPKMIIQPSAVLKDAQKMRVPYELKEGQSRLFHKLPSGLDMEVIVQKGAKEKDPDEKNPPLVFVHGSYHAAWCWAEHWLPFFSVSGFDCYAISLLGQGESDSPTGTVAGSLQTHAGDVADFIQKKLNLPPVLLGHSFGGLIIQYYIANMSNGQFLETSYPKLLGAVLVCSVPPSGNSGLVWRYLFSKPIAAFKVTRSLAAKAFQTSLSLCRETFFSPIMEDSLVLRYQTLMKESSRMPLFDLRKLNASLPVPRTEPSLKILVLGANDDFIVDAEGLSETGRFYSVSPICIAGVAHDMMLDCSWEKGAKVILSWLNGLRQIRT